MNRFAGIVILLILSGAISSCSFRKLVAGKKPKVYDWNTAKDSSDTSHLVAGAPMKDPLLNAPEPAPVVNKLIEAAKPLWNNRPDYTTFAAKKVKMHMEGPDNSVDFIAHIRVRKDSVIWLNVTVLGASFARVLITLDSFFMVNYIQKTYFAIPLSNVAKILPTKVDFNSLQNLVMGVPLRNGIITNAQSRADTLAIMVEDSSYLQQIVYTQRDSNMVSSLLRMRRADGDGPVAVTDYSDYEKVNGRKMSTHRVLNLKNGNDAYLLEMEFTKTDFDEAQDYPFRIPENYTMTK